MNAEKWPLKYSVSVFMHSMLFEVMVRWVVLGLRLRSLNYDINEKVWRRD